MRRAQRIALAAVAASLAAVFAGTSIVQAKPRHHVAAARPLTVVKRPFTDTGNVVPVGSQSHYVYDTQYLSRSPQYYGNRSLYGQEVLPGPFDPGYNW